MARSDDDVDSAFVSNTLDSCHVTSHCRRSYVDDRPAACIAKVAELGCGDVLVLEEQVVARQQRIVRHLRAILQREWCVGEPGLFVRWVEKPRSCVKQNVLVRQRETKFVSGNRTADALDSA